MWIDRRRIRAALLIRRDPSDALVVSPDFDGAAIDMLARFDQNRIVVLALDDHRRTGYPALSIQPVQSIGKHNHPRDDDVLRDDGKSVRLI